ncbi:MAG: tRNA (adenosine(37)-N6)-threonylcarbamoyltransferase complex ATPase subunit type 1 TsaE [Deltaproteobacteria bacterium]|nr:tRNA (adenosine(37)-N6)-threonylcarbamoyltransferase complex ATPase subunit type 1 TsaE [Deltaproteobacteria bacterium]
MTTIKRTLILIAKSSDVTSSIGAKLGNVLEKGEIIALIGELGSGKTLLTQGIAKGLGVSDAYNVTSPTFNIINEYPGRLTLYHMDIYRLGGVNDLEDIGFEEYMSKNGVIVIEWAEKIKDIIPDRASFIYLSSVNETTRKIKIQTYNNQIIDILNDYMREGDE